MKIGTYKNKPILLSHLHYEYTYSGVYYLTKEYAPIFNKEFIEKTVPKRVIKYFGENRPWVIFGLDKLDIHNFLPRAMVYAWLDSPNTADDPMPGPDGSHLFLVWFQNYDENPFTKAVEILNAIDWEKEAKDYEW